MEFGVFNLMGYRSPGHTTAELLKDAVEITRVADDGGLGVSWFAEHHFSNYCVCPSPLLMAAHCAPVTRRIRLGAGVLVLPLYTPARVIAEIGMVDSMSQGRLVVGIGSGYQPFEFERFGRDLAESKEATIELLEMIEMGLTRDFIEYRGKQQHMPRSHISARTYSGRLPEIWIAGDAPALHRIAAEKGYGMMTNGRFVGPAAVGQRRADFERPFIAAGKDPDDLKWGLLRFCCVTDSRKDAEEYADNARWQLRLAAAMRKREDILEGHMLVPRNPAPNEPPLDEIIANQMIGDVETCIERGIEEIRRTNAAHIALYFQIGDFPQEKALKSLELFAAKVIPGIERELGPLAQYPTSARPENQQNRLTA
ncbi:LLM class flavin-dependent oxidoreductase [Pseudochelatococcus sp. B33]